MQEPTVCVLTSVHSALDGRILRKQAVSLAAAGYRTILIGPHEKKEVVSGVQILPTRRSSGRLRRFLSLRHILRMAIDQRADVYHLHDPELLLICPLLKRRTRAKIIFDFHENVVHQIRDKEWIPRSLRSIVSVAYAAAEARLLNFVDLVIIAEDSYAKNYPNRKELVCVHNYPITPSYDVGRIESRKYPRLVYVGGLSEVRGILKILDAAGILKKNGLEFELLFVGRSVSETFDRQIREKIREHGLGEIVNLTGPLLFQAAQDLVRQSDIGLSVLQPVKNYFESYPTKLFEYMIAGLPVVASDFPIIKPIVDQNGCGLTVDPADPDAIARAISWLCEHPGAAQKMGERGREAVVEKYDWERDAAILLNAYSRLLDIPANLSHTVAEKSPIPK